MEVVVWHAIAGVRVSVRTGHGTSLCVGCSALLLVLLLLLVVVVQPRGIMVLGFDLHGLWWSVLRVQGVLHEVVTIVQQS